LHSLTTVDKHRERSIDPPLTSHSAAAVIHLRRPRRTTNLTERTADGCQARSTPPYVQQSLPSAATAATAVMTAKRRRRRIAIAAGANRSAA